MMFLLEEIVAEKMREVEKKKTIFPVERLENLPRRDRVGFMSAMKKPGLSVIAEIKRMSPSRGPVWMDANSAVVAEIYQQNGADAISVLTDTPYFGGRLNDIQSAREACSLPILKKEFIIDEYQLLESQAVGADAVLLIVRILDDDVLKSLLTTAMELGLDCLVEVHSEAELDRALSAGANIIGINNRDLDTLNIDLNTSIRLVGQIPCERICISESGIKNGDDARLLEEAGFHGILVGELLMRSINIPETLNSLKAGAHVLQ